MTEGKIMKRFIVITTALLMLSTLPGWSQYGRRGNGAQNRSAYCPRVDATIPPQDLSADEAARLLYIREEEKLAHDVYIAMYTKWGLRVFQNIAAAENRHFNAIGYLITRYQLSDPALPKAGEFSNRELQQTYESLLAKGQRSLADAIEVALSIEEKSIERLKEAIATTDNKDIQTIYENLLNGSQNHLNAFSRQRGGRTLR